MKREKITPKELVERFEGCVAMDRCGEWFIYVEEPDRGMSQWSCDADPTTILNYLFDIQWEGNWQDSLYCPKAKYKDNELILVWNEDYYYVDVVRFRSYADNPKNNIIAYSNDNDYNKSYPYHRPFDEYLAKTPIEDWVK